MPTAEKERLALYEQLNSTLGPEPAETLMEYLPPQKWADLATKEDLRLFAKENGAEITELRADMTKLGAELRGEMQTGFARMEAKFAQVESKFAEMESKFAQQTRTTVLALAGFAATIWASMLATVLVVT